MPDDGVATWSTTFGVVDLLLEGIRADIGTLHGDLGDLRTGVGGDFDNVGALLTSLRADIEAVKTELGLLDIPPDTSPDVGTLRADVAALKTSVAALQTDVATAKTNITALQTNVTSLLTRTTNVEARATSLETRATSLETRASNLESDVAALKTESLTFVWGGSPVQGSVIIIPLAYNLTIPSGLSGSHYYNVTNPLVASTFTLARIANVTNAVTTIGTVSVNTAGQGSFSGAGSSVLAAGDKLRMTATTIGGSLANVGITIRATRR